MTSIQNEAAKVVSHHEVTRFVIGYFVPRLLLASQTLRNRWRLPHGGPAETVDFSLSRTALTKCRFADAFAPSIAIALS